MGRSTPTDEEYEAGISLVERLKRLGYWVTRVRFRDRPDLRFFDGGIPHGVEITHLLPEDVQVALRLFRQKKYAKGVKHTRLTVPVEPEFWAREAIERKVKQVRGYEPSHFTANISLLLHYPKLGNEDIFDYDDKDFVAALAYAAHSTEHSFVNIAFWSGRAIYILKSKFTATPAAPDTRLLSEPKSKTIWAIHATGQELKEMFSRPTNRMTKVAHADSKYVRSKNPKFKEWRPSNLSEDEQVGLSITPDPSDPANVVLGLHDLGANE